MHGGQRVSRVPGVVSVQVTPIICTFTSSSGTVYFTLTLVTHCRIFCNSIKYCKNKQMHIRYKQFKVGLAQTIISLTLLSKKNHIYLIK